MTFIDERFNVPQTDDLNKDIYDSKDLHECLEFFENYKDLEPLRSAIAYNSKTLRKAKEELQFLIEVLKFAKQPYYRKLAEKVLITLNK